MTDTQKAHKELVKNLVKDSVDILNEITCQKLALIHAALGISGEAGEILDAIKKACIYNQQLDVKHVIEEMGDIEFYLENLRQILDLNREDILEANLKKLEKRYGTGAYTNDQARLRADKKDDS